MDTERRINMRKRLFEVQQWEKTTITVDKETHILAKFWAKRHGYTMSEAMFMLVGRAICEDEGLDFSTSAVFKWMEEQGR